MTDDLRDRKRALRARMRGVRSAISPEDRERQEAEVERRLLGLPEVGAARTVLTYLSIGSEVETSGIVGRLREQGIRVLVPVVEDEEIRAVELLPGALLVTSRFGIMAPADGLTVEPDEIDMVVAPGLAFDRTGARLGFGGGYFDRFLPRLRANCAIVAVAFHEQVIDEVPARANDVPVHAIVTDGEVMRTARPAAGGAA